MTPVPQGQLTTLSMIPTLPLGQFPPFSRKDCGVAGVVPEGVGAGGAEEGVGWRPPDDRSAQLRTGRGFSSVENVPSMLDWRKPSANALEFCVGSTRKCWKRTSNERSDQYSRQGASALLHCRNVRGKFPTIRGLIDEGDVDMLACSHPAGPRLRGNHPRHTPDDCDAPWMPACYTPWLLRGEISSLVHLSGGASPA